MQQRPPSTARFVGDDESKAEYDLNGIADCESNDIGKIMTEWPVVRYDCTSTSTLSQDLVLYYFSAHWCPPCRQFTPMLKDFYEVQLLAPNWAQNNIILNSRQEAEGIEIVFVSSDRSAEDMASYMKVMTPQGGKSIKTTKQWMTMKVAKINRPVCRHKKRG